VLRLLRVSRPEVLLVDGVEPLLGDGALELPAEARRLLGGSHVPVFATAGAAPPGLVEEALTSRGYRGVLFEYLLHLEKPPGGIGAALRALEVAAEHAKVLEILFPWLAGRRGQEQIVSSLASRYPWAGIHVVAGDESAEQAARIVEKLRSRGANVYLHPDEAYLYSDTICPKCGEILVSRKPWGVKLRVEPRGPEAEAVCPRCGARQRLLACKPRRPRAIHRKHVVW
jgi:RNase P subunit RPR2